MIVNFPLRMSVPKIPAKVPMAICTVPAKNMANGRMLPWRREARLPATAINRTIPNHRFIGLDGLVGC